MAKTFFMIAPFPELRFVKSFFYFYLKGLYFKGLTAFAVLSLFLLTNLDFWKKMCGLCFNFKTQQTNKGAHT
jgi:hypothetical protein